VRRCLTGACRARPLVALFEDIHWAAPPLLELIEHLAEWMRESPLLLICLSRPELVDRRPDWGEGAAIGRRLLLQPLSEDEGLALIDRLHDVPPLSDAAQSRIVAAAEGNPLFVEQMVAFARGRPGSGGAVTVPPNIQSLLAARVDELHERERAALAHASVIGREFRREPLAALLDGEGLTRVLRALARKQFLEPLAEEGALRWRFRHSLIRDAAYDSLPLVARAALHERYGDWLESREAEVVGEVVGYHLEQAFRCRSSLNPSDPYNAALGKRAGARLLAAGQLAFQRDDAGVAADLLERAIALPFEDNSTARQALPMLGEAHANAGDYERADAALNAAIEDGRRTGDKALEANALIQQLWVQMAMGRANLSTLLGRARQARAWLSEVGDAHGLAEAHLQIAEVLRGQGQISAAEPELERALRYARSAGDDRQMTRILWLINGCQLDGLGHVADVEEHAEYCLRWARERGRGATPEAAALRVLAWTHAVRGDFGTARELLAEAATILEDRGLHWFLAAFGTYVADVELLAGETEAAEHALRESYAMCAELGDAGSLCSVAASLAHTLIRQGRQQDALPFIKVSESGAVADDIDAQVRWRTAQALITVEKEPDAALQLAETAIGIVDATDVMALRAHAYGSLAELLLRLRRHPAALDAARPAHQIYNAKGYEIQAGELADLIDCIEHAK
jgi:predicted ATPase